MQEYMRGALSLAMLMLRQGHDPAGVLVRLALRKALLDCDRVLDVGCGCSQNMRLLGVKHCTGIEGYRPSFDEAKRRRMQDELVFGDIRELDGFFRPGQFDACVAADVIEHLTKEDGLRLLASMERLATRKVVVLTPSGYLPQTRYMGDDLLEHLSGWEPDEMEKLGYKVTGLLGPKGLRGEWHFLKKKPKVFWGVVSLLGHFFVTRNQPAKAAAMICVRSMPGTRGP